MTFEDKIKLGIGIPLFYAFVVNGTAMISVEINSGQRMTGPAFLSKEEIREQVKQDLGGESPRGKFNYFISTPGRELTLSLSYHI